MTDGAADSGSIKAPPAPVRPPGASGPPLPSTGRPAFEGKAAAASRPGAPPRTGGVRPAAARPLPPTPAGAGAAVKRPPATRPAAQTPAPAASVPTAPPPVAGAPAAPVLDDHSVAGQLHRSCQWRLGSSHRSQRAHASPSRHRPRMGQQCHARSPISAGIIDACMLSAGAVRPPTISQPLQASTRLAQRPGSASATQPAAAAGGPPAQAPPPAARVAALQTGAAASETGVLCGPIANPGGSISCHYTCSN